MSAGSGILRSEKNDAWKLTGDAPHSDPVRFIQMWVVPDEDGIEPGYEQMEIEHDLLQGGLIPVASGMAGHRDAAAIRIKQKDAALYAARMGDTTTVVLPEAPFVHLFVARGAVDLEGSGRLGEGDAARITAADGELVTAIGDAEVLVWEMHAAMAGDDSR
jgi:quercetin 2,3-dioxygenase